MVIVGATTLETEEESGELTGVELVGVELVGTLAAEDALDVTLLLVPQPANKTDPAKTKMVAKRMEFFIKYLFLCFSSSHQKRKRQSLFLVKI
jgi:hypothetical protein